MTITAIRRDWMRFALVPPFRLAWDPPAGRDIREILAGPAPAHRPAPVIAPRP